MELPEVQEVRRWHPEPGDILIVQNTEVELDRDQANEVRHELRKYLRLPEELPILVIGRDWDISVGKAPE